MTTMMSITCSNNDESQVQVRCHKGDDDDDEHHLQLQ